MLQVTVGELANRLGVEYATAAALAKLAVATNQGKEIGKRPTPTGKGKPATIYEIEETLTISLTPVVQVA